MNFSHTVFILIAFSLCAITIQSVSAQIDVVSDIEFLKSGKIYADNQEYEISTNITIKEFFDGKIVRVSGLTMNNHPYITYSQIINESIQTRGIIYLNNKFVPMTFIIQETSSNKIIQKNDDLSILTSFTERLYTKQIAKIDVKIFDSSQNKLNDFNQNYGYIKDVNVGIVVFDEQNKEFAVFSGKTDGKGLFQSQFQIPENKPRGTFTIKITAENENSKSLKTIQIFNLGAMPNDGKASS